VLFFLGRNANMFPLRSSSKENTKSTDIFTKVAANLHFDFPASQFATSITGENAIRAARFRKAHAKQNCSCLQFVHRNNHSLYAKQHAGAVPLIKYWAAEF
jgi:hypothetical protein